MMNPRYFSSLKTQDIATDLTGSQYDPTPLDRDQPGFSQYFFSLLEGFRNAQQECTRLRTEIETMRQSGHALKSHLPTTALKQRSKLPILTPTSNEPRKTYRGPLEILDAQHPMDCALLPQIKIEPAPNGPSEKQDHSSAWPLLDASEAEPKLNGHQAVTLRPPAQFLRRTHSSPNLLPKSSNLSSNVALNSAPLSSVVKEKLASPRGGPYPDAAYSSAYILESESQKSIAQGALTIPNSESSNFQESGLEKTAFISQHGSSKRRSLLEEYRGFLETEEPKPMLPRSKTIQNLALLRSRPTNASSPALGSVGRESSLSPLHSTVSTISIKHTRSDQKYRKYAKSMMGRDPTHATPLQLRTSYAQPENNRSTVIPRTPPCETSCFTVNQPQNNRRQPGFQSPTISTALKMKPPVQIVRSPPRKVTSPTISQQGHSRTNSAANSLEVTVVFDLPEAFQLSDSFANALATPTDSVLTTATPALTEDNETPTFSISPPSTFLSCTFPTDPGTTPTKDLSIGLGLNLGSEEGSPSTVVEPRIDATLDGPGNPGVDVWNPEIAGSYNGAEVYNEMVGLIGSDGENMSLLNHYIGCYDEGQIAQDVLLDRARYIIIGESDGDKMRRERLYKRFEAVVSMGSEERP